MKFALIPLLLTLIISACSSTESLAQGKKAVKLVKPKFTAGPTTLVYKTRKDYSNNVPVLLSADKTKIVSYPDPSDFRNMETFPTPAKLRQGYLLDQRGIGLYVAYLKLTYEEYAALKTVPGQKEMMAMIIDKNPLTQLCNCGNRQAFTDVEKQLNDLIAAGKIRTACKKVK
jgi:hypothetical protein